jgi:hypothetical protein
MNDFDKKLLTYDKRHDKDFTKEQLHHHLVECLQLLESWDSHLYAELIDLVQITKVYLSQNLDDDQLDDLVQKRFDKFMTKLSQDKK